MDDEGDRWEAMAWQLWRRPGEALQNLPTTDRVEFSERAALLSYRASLWLAVMCFEEALDDARAAIKAGLLHAPFAHARALGVAAECLKIQSAEESVELRRLQLELIWRAGLVNTDLHVAALINAAAAQLANNSRALELLNAAEVCFRSTEYRNRDLQKCRQLLLQYHRGAVALNIDIHSGVIAAQDLIKNATDLGEPVITALCHTSLAQLFMRADLHSASLAHCSLSSHLWDAQERPERVAEDDMLRAKNLQALGRVGEARALLGKPSGAIGSRSRYLDAERYSVLANLAAFEGERSEAARLSLEGARIRHRGPISDIGEVAASWVEAAAMAAYAGGSEQAGAIEEARVALRRLPVPTEVEPQVSLFLSYLDLLEGTRTDFDGFRTQLAQVQRQGVGGIDATASMDALEGLLGMIRPSSGDALNMDLAEYWYHVTRLSAEDSEEVRTSYRSANCVPVLNRLLSREVHQIDALLHFELVELIRFATMPLGHPGDSDQSGRSLRHAARGQLQSLGLTGGVYGKPQPLSLRGHTTPLAEIAGVPPIETAPLIHPSHRDPLPLLQLSLRRNVVCWVLVHPDGSIAHGKHDLDARALEVLRDYRTCLTPVLGEFEAEVAAEVGVRTEQLPLVAAARTAMGPLVDCPELAHDILCWLPSWQRDRVTKRLSTRESLSLLDLATAIGALIPPRFLADSPSGSFLLAADLQLASLPFALAVTGPGGEALVEGRMPVAMPPLNLLAASRAVERGQNPEWTVLRVGNTRGDLSFSGTRSSSEAVRSALLCADPRIASSTAVVYSGHLLEPRAGVPSEAGLFLSADEVLRGADLLRATDTLYTPRRLALLACRAAGWDFGGEWGGIGAAAMLRDTTDLIAPIWPLIDGGPSEELDDAVASLIGSNLDLDVALRVEIANRYDDWRAGTGRSLPPHWWASLSLSTR